tara:strand:- start:713 stop:895 length:183 start_codon:yes stop_codon:yes gene_type:complete
MICPLLANSNRFTPKKPQLSGFDGLTVGLFFDGFLVKAIWAYFALLAFNDYILRCMVIII